MTLFGLYLGLRWPAMLVASAGALASCALPFDEPAAPIQRSVTVAASQADVRQAVEAELTKLGFKVREQTDGSLKAMHNNPPGEGYANCRSIQVAWNNGQDNVRYRRAQPLEEIVSVQAGFAADDGATTATFDPTITGVYANRVTGSGIDTKCPSNGRLERLLIDAATSAAG